MGPGFGKRSELAEMEDVPAYPGALSENRVTGITDAYLAAPGGAVFR
ncbi:hypothetical protein sS8_1237 [Methylocaldum marinum]|uniref:Uncharacterized protein n=1 Tax=Methylocaldum marinum TaxID=1432792 RepID=A0A250KTT7_9GAMM|nr:hypothetical protein sS8_1237 [Methylocaldum marinum]